jgi:hypothetical protein
MFITPSKQNIFLYEIFSITKSKQVDFLTLLKVTFLTYHIILVS